MARLRAAIQTASYLSVQNQMASAIQVIAVLAAIVLCSPLVSAQTRSLQATNVISQTSIAWNRSVTGGDPLAKLAFNDSRLANTAGGLDPSQVRSAGGRPRGRLHLMHLRGVTFQQAFETQRSPFALQGHANMLVLSARPTLTAYSLTSKRVTAGSPHIHWLHKRDCFVGNW